MKAHLVRDGNPRHAASLLAASLILLSVCCPVPLHPASISVSRNVVRASYVQALECRGFDYTRTPNIVMAPIRGNNIIGINVEPLSQASKTRFTPTESATITPLVPLGVEQPEALHPRGLRVTGRSATTIFLRRDTGAHLNPIEAWVLDRQPMTKVAMHIVYEENDDGFAAAGSGLCIVAGPNGHLETPMVVGDTIVGNSIAQGPDGDCDTKIPNAGVVAPENVPSEASVLAYLNRYWGLQANRFFTIESDSLTVDYDLDNDGLLRWAAKVGVNDEEMNVIARAPTTIKDAKYHLYFVRRIQPVSPTTERVGYAYPDAANHDEPLVNRAFLGRFVGSFGPIMPEVVFAHELGHLMGQLEHNMEKPEALMYFAATPIANPCEVFAADWDAVNH